MFNVDVADILVHQNWGHFPFILFLYQQWHKFLDQRQLNITSIVPRHYYLKISKCTKLTSKALTFPFRSRMNIAEHDILEANLDNN